MITKSVNVYQFPHFDTWQTNALEVC